MAGAADGVGYLYENVGIGATTASQPGVGYLYENVGVGVNSFVVGRVQFNLTADYGVAYTYENVT